VLKNLDLMGILQLGVVGIGFLLAYLSYGLLRGEQKRQDVRYPMLRAAYVFMAFSLVICGFSLLVKRWEISPNNGSPAGPITWDYRMDSALKGSNDYFMCQADDEDIGSWLNCRDYGVCNSRSGNLLICQGQYYPLAIERKARVRVGKRN
jgi:hypothetical protein